MKWSMLTAYDYWQQFLGGYIEVPIRCSDYLYTFVPTNGSTLTLLSPRQDGYLNLTELTNRVEEVLYFLPFTQGQYECSEDIFSNPLFVACMKAFGGYDRLQVADRVDTTYFGIDNDTNSLLGYRTDFYSDSNKCTSGFFRPPYSYVAYDSISINLISNVEHFVYKFDIYPEEFIQYGHYFIDALQGPFEGWGDYDRLYGNVSIDVWFDSTLNKYNCEVLLYGVQLNTQSIYSWFNNLEVDHIYDYDDPTNNDPNQNNNGGNGDNNNTGEPVPMPSLPGSDMTASGSIRVYSMTASQIKDMFDYLHSNNPGDAILKWWTNPIQGVVSLHYLPYAVLLKGGAESIKVCGMDTTIQANPAEQWQEINFSYVYCPTNKNTYLDRAPYTRVQIYLPGIGIRDLNTDDVIGKYVFVRYQCDNVSGQFVAYVLVSNNTKASDASVKYSFSGSVAAPFPISQNNWGNTYIAAATLAAGALAVGASAAGGAAAAGAAGASGTATAGAEAGTAAGVSGGSIGGAAVNVGSSLSQLAKPSITRSGTVSGTTSLFSVKQPYLIIEKPNIQDFADFNKIKGYACGKTFKLGDLTGYTEVEKIHIHGLTATAGEINEIEALLRSGVML